MPKGKKKEDEQSGSRQNSEPVHFPAQREKLSGRFKFRIAETSGGVVTTADREKKLKERKKEIEEEAEKLKDEYEKIDEELEEVEELLEAEKEEEKEEETEAEKEEEKEEETFDIETAKATAIVNELAKMGITEWNGRPLLPNMGREPLIDIYLSVMDEAADEVEDKDKVENESLVEGEVIDTTTLDESTDTTTLDESTDTTTLDESKDSTENDNSKTKDEEKTNQD